MLTARGYRVIRYDNRDVGLSQKFESAGPADVAKMMTEMAQGKKPSTAYTLEDMANDAAGLRRAWDRQGAHRRCGVGPGLLGSLSPRTIQGKRYRQHPSCPRAGTGASPSK